MDVNRENPKYSVAQVRTSADGYMELQWVNRGTVRASLVADEIIEEWVDIHNELVRLKAGIATLAPAPSEGAEQ